LTSRARVAIPSFPSSCADPPEANGLVSALWSQENSSRSLVRSPPSAFFPRFLLSSLYRELRRRPTGLWSVKEGLPSFEMPVLDWLPSLRGASSVLWLFFVSPGSLWFRLFLGLRAFRKSFLFYSPSMIDRRQPFYSALGLSFLVRHVCVASAPSMSSALLSGLVPAGPLVLAPCVLVVLRGADACFRSSSARQPSVVPFTGVRTCYLRGQGRFRSLRTNVAFPCNRNQKSPSALLQCVWIAHMPFFSLGPFIVQRVPNMLGRHFYSLTS